MDIYVTNNPGPERTCLMVDIVTKSYNIFTGCLSARYFRPDVLSVDRKTILSVFTTVKVAGWKRDPSLA